LIRSLQETIRAFVELSYRSTTQWADETSNTTTSTKGCYCTNV